MIIGERLRLLREAKVLSQGDIEERSGLSRCYVCRVESGRTIPSLGTLERWSRALQISLYQIFYEGEAPPPWVLPKPSVPSSDQESRLLNQFRKAFAKMDDRERDLLLQLARIMERDKYNANRPKRGGRKVQRNETATAWPGQSCPDTLVPQSNVLSAD